MNVGRDKRSAFADNSGGCATPKNEFWHPTRLNQSFPNMVLVADAMMQQPRVNNQNVKLELHLLKKINGYVPSSPNAAVGDGVFYTGDFIR